MKQINSFFMLSLMATLMLVSANAFAENLSLSASATASTGTATLATDGNSGTRWESAHGEGIQVFTIDLASPSTIDSVKIHWEGANAKVYTLKTSTDNVNWTLIDSVIDGESADRWDKHTLSSAPASHVMITCIERNLTWGYSAWEIEVHGNIDAAKDATLSDLAVDASSVSGFSAGITSYPTAVAPGAVLVPTVTATTSQVGASIVIVPAAQIPGSTTVTVTSSDGTVDKIYSVSFFDPNPSTTALTPTPLAADVISVYSDTYTSIVSDINPNWGQATQVTEMDYSGNMILKYESLNYQGMAYANTDISAMEYVHLDYYTKDATALEFFLIAGGENSYNIQSELGLTTGQWVGVDIPLSYYADAGRDLTSATQFKTVGNGTLFLDNIYFWKAPLVIESVPPTNFTASLSDTTHNSVEFTLSAEDNSGAVSYYITYGMTTDSLTGISGAATTHTVVDLSPSTAYSFSVSVKDPSGNEAANNPISLNVNTKEAPVTSSCGGTSSEAFEGEFSVGYTYNFESVGGDVTANFELLDTEKEGVVAYLFNRTDGFSESAMANTDGVFSVSLGAQTIGDTLTLACKFAFAGGLAVTKDFEYKVGDNCLGTVTKVNSTSSIALRAYPTPVVRELTINLGDQSYKQFTVYSMSGKAIVSQAISNETTILNINMSTYNTGIYMIKLENNTESKMLRVIKK